MGLRFTDLESWRHWRASRMRLRSGGDKRPDVARDLHATYPDMEWWIRGSEPRLLAACDSASPATHHCLLAPLLRDPGAPALVVQPRGVSLHLPGDGWRRLAADEVDLDPIGTLTTFGHHLAVGTWAHKMARLHGWRELVIQKDLLTPFSPPPPPRSTVLVWSEADGAFLRKGRRDLVTLTVGSPALAAAAAQPAPHISRFITPVFLGQMHDPALPWLAMTRSVTEFWRRSGARYRPGPSERDRLSLAQQAIWRRMGMDIETSAPTVPPERPVVAAFSIGLLEAAACGVPAWVFHRRPPRWLEEVWQRYGLSRWGGPATPAPDIGNDPVHRIWHHLRGG